jgi:hypothetical protein
MKRHRAALLSVAARRLARFRSELKKSLTMARIARLLAASALPDPALPLRFSHVIMKLHFLTAT